MGWGFCQFSYSLEMWIMITTQTQPLARCFPFFRSIWQDRAGYFVSIFRPQQSLFFSRLKKVPKKGEHAAMQDFGARDTLVFILVSFYRTDRLHHSIFV